MKQSLQLGISHQLTLTPQLQQAIRLLQLSTVELQTEIQRLVESNPMLEVSSEEDKDSTAASDVKDNYNNSLDTQWSYSFQPSKNKNFEELNPNYDNLYTTTTSLREHLHWQLNLTALSEDDKAIATTLIDATDDNGFLTVTVDEIHASLNSLTKPIEKDEVEMVRHLLQSFDPVGCVSEDLVDTLLVQVKQLSVDNDSNVSLATKIIQDDIKLLGQHNYRQIMKNYKVDEQTLRRAIQIIQSLNPKPGSSVQSSMTEYVIPDVIAKKINGNWDVRLNRSTLPKLNINQYYASFIQRADNSSDNQFLKNNLQEARWFLKSIQSRQETLLKVANCIVDYQKEFLEHGDEGMKPLVLNDVAQALGMHESTISRVTTQKYIHTPRGLFELKYFFSSHVATIGGGECSSTAIRALIKKLIHAENPKKPLSDSKISELMGTQGIQVARRTIAKYREAMGIAPSNERKMIPVI